MITVTDSAVKQLQSLLAEARDTAGKGLRVFVEHGGCAGRQYGMNLDKRKDGDLVTDRDGVQFFVDAGSACYLEGATLDYADGLTGSGFRIQNPNAVRSCGCGSSFEAPDPNAENAHAQS